MYHCKTPPYIQCIPKIQKDTFNAYVLANKTQNTLGFWYEKKSAFVISSKNSRIALIIFYIGAERGESDETRDYDVLLC